MRITIVGAGFVGEATGRGLKKHGHDIKFVDIDREKLAKLENDGYETGHPDEESELFGDVTMFCVPTPTHHSVPDLSYIQQAITQFGLLLVNNRKYHVAVIRSTVPPGTVYGTIVPLIEKVSGKVVGRDFGVVMQPEYLREATANEDFERPWFVLIGEHDKKSGDLVEKIYSTFDVPIERSKIEEAEFQKYVHNIYNAVKIAFFNEMRIVAKRQKWNPELIFKATAESCEGMWNPLYGTKDYGPFDGSCLPKDTQALLAWADRTGHSLNILQTVVDENLKHQKILGKNKTVRINHLAEVAA